MAIEVSTLGATKRSESRAGWINKFANWLAPATVLAILFLTQMPFEYSRQGTSLRRMGPFLTWFAPVSKDPFGWFLNVLLFLPLGFGIAWWGREKGWSQAAAWITAFFAGLILSFSVEFLQLYLPMRDSSWDDVFMNTLGSLLGVWLLERWGAALLTFIEGAFADLSEILHR